MTRRSWSASRRTQRESRTIALLQLVTAIAWWLFALHEGRRTWSVVVAVLWTLSTIRSLLSWWLWRPQSTTPINPHDSALDTDG